MFAERSPSVVTTRAVAEASGCSHGMIAALFGGKPGLERAVSDLLANTIDAAIERFFASSALPFAELLRMRHDDPLAARLLVRFGLGDLERGSTIPGRAIGERLVARIEEARGGSARRPTQRSRIAAHSVLCTVLGTYTFDAFNLRASRSHELDAEVRDVALVEALELVAGLAADESVGLRVQRQRDPVALPSVPREPAHGRIELRDALINATIELFTARGPSSISVREISERAGVPHGLIHRYFGTKDALLNAAIDRLARPVTTGMVGPDGVSIEALVRLQTRSANPWIIARLTADGIDVTATRTSYPLFDAVLGTFPEVPSGTGPGDLSDPRLAVYALASLVSGVAVWDRPVRRLVGLPPADEASLDLVLTRFCQRFLDAAR